METKQPVLPVVSTETKQATLSITKVETSQTPHSSGLAPVTPSGIPLLTNGLQSSELYKIPIGWPSISGPVHVQPLPLSTSQKVENKLDEEYRRNLAELIVRGEDAGTLSDNQYEYYTKILFNNLNKLYLFQKLYPVLLPISIIYNLDTKSISLVVGDNTAATSGRSTNTPITERIFSITLRNFLSQYNGAAIRLIYGPITNILWISSDLKIDRYDPINTNKQPFQAQIDTDLSKLFSNVLPGSEYHPLNIEEWKYIIGNSRAKSRKYSYKYLTEDYCLMYIITRETVRDHQGTIDEMFNSGENIIDQLTKLMLDLSEIAFTSKIGNF